VREKLFRLTGDELPYTSTVVVEKYEEVTSPQAQAAPSPPPEEAVPPWGGPAAARHLVRISAAIVVEREAHKGMVIGDGGERLKRIGSEARQELEKLLDAKVFLELWVKVRSGWADDEAHLRSYGYE
jgi:GTP-binding protein Era